jgi:hypothetical protein
MNDPGIAAIHLRWLSRRLFAMSFTLMPDGVAVMRVKEQARI